MKHRERLFKSGHECHYRRSSLWVESNKVVNTTPVVSGDNRVATAVGDVLVRLLQTVRDVSPLAQGAAFAVAGSTALDSDMPNKVLSLLLRQIPWMVTMEVGSFVAVNRDGISETGAADGSLAHTSRCMSGRVRSKSTTIQFRV